MSRHLLAILVTLTASACASNVEVRYPAPPETGRSGSVLIRLSEPMRAVSVSIDGLLVAEDQHTERVHIADVPAGARHVSIAASAGDRAASVERTVRVDVAPGRESSILVSVPPRSLGSWIASAAMIVASAAILIADDWR